MVRRRDWSGKDRWDKESHTLDLAEGCGMIVIDACCRFRTERIITRMRTFLLICHQIRPGLNSAHEGMMIYPGETRPMCACIAPYLNEEPGHIGAFT